MLLPLTAWAVTGAIFFIKPGYGAAYDALPIKTYPIARMAIDGDPAWLEARYLKTVLGDHLLVRTSAGWQHLDPSTRQARPSPGDQEIRALVADATAANPARYGSVTSVSDNVATTDTGARVTVNWKPLSLSQRGRDTDRIDAIYKVHYLQWTGIALLDRVVGGLGLVLILVLSGLGVRLWLRAR